MDPQPLKKATIHDVAKLANVGCSTVSRALNEWKQSSIKPATRERILAAAAELRYRPSPMAQQLKSRKSRVVAVVQMGSSEQVTPVTGTPAISLSANDAIGGATSVLDPIGYRVAPFSFMSPEQAEKTLIELFWAGHFDAVLFPFKGLNSLAEQLAREGCIVITPSPPKKGVSNLYQVPARSLQLDPMPPIEEVIRQGRTRILFTFTVPEKASKVYSRELRSGKLRFESSGEREIHSQIDSIVEMVLSRNIDAVITGDEFFGWEIFRALNQCGVDVPERVTITGNADIRHMFKPLPILYFLYAERFQFTRAMAIRLIEILTKEHRMNFEVPRSFLPYEPVLQVLSPSEFTTAARAELRRERLLGQIEAQVLGLRPPQKQGSLKVSR